MTRIQHTVVLSSALVQWHKKAGRHDLPWQQDRTPYRVWVSEIMLQQTQVGTVIPYFERFMQRFPDIYTLAEASIDEVLYIWTGLGYYARARNLHRAAKQICDQFSAEVPSNFSSLLSLPGIGRSTAGAILALAYDANYPILDGNVKRVLARFFGIEGYTGELRVEKILWQLAEDFTPKDNVAIYTQAIMDLGATLCTRHNPVCDQCPLKENCITRINGMQHAIPSPKAKGLSKSSRKSYMLLIKDSTNSYFLERRPAQGIWGGLWCFPEFKSKVQAQNYAKKNFTDIVLPLNILPKINHSFTHFNLQILPLQSSCRSASKKLFMEPIAALWYKPLSVQGGMRIGLPAPVRQLLENITTATGTRNSLK